MTADDSARSWRLVSLELERDQLAHAALYAEMFGHPEIESMLARIAKLDAEIALERLEYQSTPAGILHTLTAETEEAHYRAQDLRVAAWITGSAYHRREAERADAWARWTAAGMRALLAKRERAT
jgi:hypothetical protein